jgi:hypothetical protein
MTAGVFWVGLVIQLAGWPILYWLTAQFDIWRENRAKARGRHAGHFNELVFIMGLINIGVWLIMPLMHWIRTPAEVKQ